MSSAARPLVDLQAVEARGELLRCPACGAWVRALLIVAGQTEPVCKACAAKRNSGENRHLR
jgi:hypothetical protein